MDWIETLEGKTAYKICAIVAEAWTLKLYSGNLDQKRDFFYCVCKIRQRWGEKHSFICGIL